jgi:signal transduction histidine kinase
MPLTSDESKEYPALLASMPASVQQRRIAFGVIVFLSVVFAIVIPFARIQTVRVDDFVPIIQSMLCFADLFTAVFLFAQYSIQPQGALLALASGYIFSGLFALLQTFAFPGAYAPSGLIGDGTNSAAWLYVLWHVPFSLAIIVYTLLKGAGKTVSLSDKSTVATIRSTITCVLAVTVVLTYIVTQGARYLPSLYVNVTKQTPFTFYVNSFMGILSLAALVLLFARSSTILDLWLIVTVFATLPEHALAAIVTSFRFTVGWYTAHSYGLFASCTVLTVLIVETTMLYARLASATLLQRRERDNRLMSVDAAISAIAHEINQPLTAISLNCSTGLELLKSTPLDLEEVRACLTASKDDTDRAGEIIAGIRGLFKTAPRRSTMIEINSIVGQVLQMVEHDLQVHGVSVSTEFQEGLPQIMADRTQLQQVILNLVRNAIDAMDAGPATKRTLRLVTTQDGNSAVSLSIQDSGPGINPENETRVFDPFFTTKSSGMGLGLSISRSVIEDYSGELRLTKTNSNGCTFEIALPSAVTSDSGLGRPHEASV